MRETNFFYPLSALLMLIGCYTLSHALALEPGRVAGLSALISTLHVYELLVTSLVLVVLLRLRVPDDAASLIAIETLFLADAALLLNELLAADFAWGIAASVVTVLLAGLKLASLVKGTGVRVGPPMQASVLVLLLVLSVPALFALAARSRALDAGLVHAWWWAAAAACGTAMALAYRHPLARADDEAAVALARGLTVVPGVSLIVHLYAGGWVYDVAFRWVNVAPVLLGVAGAAAFLPAATRRLVALPVAALMLTLDVAPDVVTSTGGLMLSPFRGVVAGSAILYAWVFARWRHPAAAAAAMACAAVALAGHTPDEVASSFSSLFDRALPRGAQAWGALMVALAFASLALGAGRSARKAGYAAASKRNR
jgi:hypothetical protein